MAIHFLRLQLILPCVGLMKKKTNQNNQIFCSILCWPEEKKHKYNLILRFFPNNFDKNPHLEEFVKVMGGAVEEDKEAAAFLNL